jgi:hypothetical protein
MEKFIVLIGSQTRDYTTLVPVVYYTSTMYFPFMVILGAGEEK